ncbi:hypothetical protein LCGC14_2404920, partial [marine sediment metagenome]
MSESVQPIFTLNSRGLVDYSGLMTTTLDALVGNGTVAQSQTFIDNQWIRVRRNVTGDNIVAQYFGLHNFIHAFLDPTHVGPLYIIRISECIVPSFGASVGRVFFGFGEFVDVTDRTSLRGAGFYCDETGNWFALLRDAAGDIVRFDTGADTNQPRFLRMDIDANFKTVRWYVDEVLRKTHVMTSALDQIAAGSGPPFNDVAIQSDAGNQIDVYIASGIVAQMSIVTDAPQPLEVVPVVPGQLTYQRIINLAVTRAPEFPELVLDDQQVVDEMDVLALELVQEGSDADHTAFQQVVNWNTDILPDLTEDPAPTDLSEIDYIQLPRWINSIYSAEGVKSNGSKIEINIFSKESEIRDRPIAGLTIAYRDLGDPRVRKPQALKVWNPSSALWELYKDESNVSPGASPWDDVVDANLVVSGVPVRIGSRANLTNTVPVPFRALRPMAESFAISLGMRANKDYRW